MQMAHLVRTMEGMKGSAWAMLFLLALPLGSAAQGVFGQTLRVNQWGVDTDPDFAMDSIDLTPDGRYVVFHRYGEVLLKNLSTLLVERIPRSLPIAHLPGVRASRNAARIVFTRTHDHQVVVYDRATDRFRVASSDADGTPGGGGSPSISPDGRYVAFVSNSELLIRDGVKGDHVYVKDLETGAIVRASQHFGVPLPSGGSAPQMLANTRYVVFMGKASEMDRRWTGYQPMMCDLATGRVIVPLGPHTTNPNGAYGVVDVSGRYWFFASTEFGITHLRLLDRVSGATRLLRSLSLEEGAYAVPLAVSDGGRYAAFLTTSARVIVGDAAPGAEVVVLDSVSNAMFGITTGTQRQLANHARTSGSHPIVHLAIDAGVVVWESDASNFVAGDLEDSVDTFAHIRGYRRKPYFVLQGKVQSITAIGYPTTTVMPTDPMPWMFQYIGAADFTRDGHDDWVMFNPPNRRLWVRLIDGFRQRWAWSGLRDVPENLTAKGAGDFTNDGIPDIVLQKADTGALVGWTVRRSEDMNWIGYGDELDLGPIPTGWQVMGFPDIDQDGDADVLIRAPDRERHGVYLYEGGRRASWRTLGSIRMDYIGTADVDGDGTKDLVFGTPRNSTSCQVGSWLIRDGKVAGWYLISQPISGIFYPALAAEGR